MPFCHATLTGQKPPSKGYPASPKHVGEHIRKVRMDRGLLQREVAELVGVDRDTMRNWELGRSEPALRHWPRVHRILGFIALEIGESLPARLRAYRTIRGVSQETLAAELGVNESTIHGWETGAHTPSPPLRALLTDLLKNMTPACSGGVMPTFRLPRRCPSRHRALAQDLPPAGLRAQPPTGVR